ncbi:MAG: DUF4249 family protein [Candidatus Cloacimonas sp.]|jgi:hypothetical protein|nr:DUF4249 family protein [Candidatus Cloacimonas sp.]
MVKHLRYLLPLLLITAMSCSKFTAPERFEGDVYTVAAMLIAGQPINTEHPVYITRSSTIEDFDPYSLFVSNAAVTLTDLSDPDEWMLTAVPDLVEMKIKYIDTAQHIIQPEHRYRIEIQIPGKEQLIWAETTVPAIADLVPDYYQLGNGFSLTEEGMNAMPYTAIDQNYPFAMNTGAFSGACNFMAELYCLEDFSTDLEFTTPVFGLEHPDASMEDAYNAGGESIRRIKFIGRYTSQIQDGMDDNYLIVKDYRQAFVFYGKYRISLYIVDDNYYRYTYMPEGYMQGGVHGGLGYFGSAGGGKMYARIVK